MSLAVLVVDEDGDFPTGLLESAARPMSPTSTRTVADALDLLDKREFDCLVCTDAIDIPVEKLLASMEVYDVPVVVVPWAGSEQLAARAFRAGATDYVTPDDALADRILAAIDGVDVPDSPSTAGELPVDTDDPGELRATSEKTPVPLEAVASSLSEVLVTIDTESTIQYVNEAVEDVFGYDRERLVGAPLTTLMPERFQDPHHAAVEQYLLSGERTLDWSSITLPGQHADGHEVDLEISFGEFTADGERYFTGLLRDVTGITERETAIADLYEASRDLLLATTPEEVAQTTVEAASDDLDLPISTVFLYDETAGELVSVAQTDRAASLFGEVRLQPGASLAWETFEDGEARVFSDVGSTDRAHNPETPIHTELQVPIGEYGVLVSGTTEPREFDDYQLDFAESLATNAEAALRRAERTADLRRYQQVFGTVEDKVCVIDPDGGFRMANASLCSFLGCSEAELVGMNAAAFVDDADLAALTDQLFDLDYGESATLEVEITTLDDETYPCEVNFTTFPETVGIDGVVAAIRDITDRKAVESELAQQRSRFARLFENVPDPVVEAELRDGTPIVQSVNDAFAEIFGYDESTVRGESLNEYVVPPAGDDRASNLDRRAADGEQVAATVKRETADGIRYFLFRGIPVADGPDGTLAFGVYTDITDQRLRQRRLSVLNRVFRHNIRNDMSVILNAAELIQATTDDEQVLDSAAMILRNAHDLVALTEDIRTAERVLDRDTGTAYPLEDVVRDAVTQSRADPAAVSIRFPDGSLPRVDDRMEIAIAELVTNAVEHSDGQPAIDVDVAVEERLVTVTVADDGPGIPDVERRVIEREEETPLEHTSGFGLWLVNLLVTSLGGELSFTESPLGGAAVRIRFPTATPDD